MTTLAFDTATPAPSLAVVRDGNVVAERQIAAQVGAGRRVAEEIHGILVESSLTLDAVDCIVVGVGPGGFTGIRIGIATALGLGQACDIPVVGVSTLDILARGLADRHPDAVIVPMIDARRSEVFTAAYRTTGGRLEEIAEARALPVADVADFLAPLTDPIVAGNGVMRVPDAAEIQGLHHDRDADTVRVAHAIRVVDDGGARPVQPIYLRLPDAEVNRRARAEGRE